MQRGLVSNLSFIKYIQVVQVQLSTKVKKYLYPSTVGVVYDPQISTCNRSNGTRDKWLLLENGSLFCFANGQTLHNGEELWERDVAWHWKEKAF